MTTERSASGDDAERFCLIAFRVMESAQTWSSRSRPLRENNVLAQQAEESLVLLSLLTGKHFRLEGAGRRIWELSDGSQTVDSIATAVCAEYDADRATVIQDAIELLADLAAEGLVEDRLRPDAGHTE